MSFFSFFFTTFYISCLPLQFFTKQKQYFNKVQSQVAGVSIESREAQKSHKISSLTARWNLKPEAKNILAILEVFRSLGFSIAGFLLR